jgi:hypothetical protein
VEAATYISLLVIGIPLLAVRMSWWQGAFFISTPMVVLVAIYVPFSIAGCTLWLGPYRWLTGRTKHALVLYGVIVLASSSVVLQVDPVQMERGQFTTTGGDWRWEVQ